MFSQVIPSLLDVWALSLWGGGSRWWFFMFLAACRGTHPRGHPTLGHGDPPPPPHPHPMDQREAGCGATSLPRQTQPRPVLMSWKVGPQLLALTGAGCRGRASAPGPQLGTQTLHQDINGPAGPSGASLLHLLPPHFIPLFCAQSPCPSPQSRLPWDG